MAKSYGDSGWIKLWRAEMHDPLYFAEPFTRWQAWVDLQMLADEEGAVKTSIKALKNRWLWGSETKVRNYLRAVQEAGKGAVTSTPNKGTLIRLNTGFSDSKGKRKYRKKEADKEAVRKFEEVTSIKEVGDRTSLTSASPNNHNKNIAELEDSLGDEYES